MLDISIFQEYHRNGLLAIPLLWNEERKDVDKFPIHDVNVVKIDIEYVERLLSNGFGKANGLAIKVMPPLGMIDFDIKNTENKDVFKNWLAIISSQNPEILRKVCIEETRTGGFHVFIKHDSLREKLSIARCEGKEVIAVYTGGLLSYSYPTPGYKIIHNDFADVQHLTDDEFDFVISTAALFNEDEDFAPGSSNIKLVEYPSEYEAVCLQFDNKITDDIFEKLLNEMTLFRLAHLNAMFKRAKYIPYLRKGSKANYSAKVYWNSRKVLIFSASVKGYPTWHDSAHQSDIRWVLTPARIVFYKNNRDWNEAIEEMQMIMESAGLDFTPQQQLGSINTGFTQHDDGTVEASNLKFPYDIFPPSVQDFICRQVIQNEYIAAGVLAAVSTVIGNSAYLEAMPGYVVKPILYIGVVAPPGAAKTPALNKAFAPLERIDSINYDHYARDLKVYKTALAEVKRAKTVIEEPPKPELHQLLIKDSTIEMVIKILSFNKNGCCLFADELSGFLARMNQYKDGDEVQKWLELWSGNPVLLQRITRDENKVEHPFCSICGGIQPGILEAMAKGDNENNGFFHRWLFCYPEPQTKPEWQQLILPREILQYYNELFLRMIAQSESKTRYILTPDANMVYKSWFDAKNKKYNKAVNDHYKGIIAKYQDYCLRFCVILQCLYEAADDQRSGFVEAANVERAIRLTEYFFANMHKAIKILKPDSPIDRMEPMWQKWYAALPEFFTTRTATEIAETIGIKLGTVKSYIHRNVNVLFKTGIEKGTYEKLY